MNWTRINLLISLWFFAALVVSRIPESLAAPLLSGPQATSGVVFLFVTGLRSIASALKTEATVYAPLTVHDAKRFNEQLKLTATAINGVALALATVISINEFARNDDPNWTWIILAAAVALHFHVQARTLLGLLKDESAPPLPSVQ